MSCNFCTGASRFPDNLKRTDVREFLGSYGYEDVEPEKMLERLSKRVCQYSEEKSVFRREGAFLDYPIDDVKMFSLEKRWKKTVWFFPDTGKSITMPREEQK
mgnify:CR=1 FL=1